MLLTNIGILNALIRITIGLTILSWSTAKIGETSLERFLFVYCHVWGDEGGRGNCSFLSSDCSF